MRRLVQPCALAFAILLAGPAGAQRCIDVKTGASLDLVRLPASAAKAYQDCHTTTDDHGAAAIGDYGDNSRNIDTFVAQKTRDFNVALMAGYQGPQLSAATQDQAKQLAATVNGMTDDQKKAFAMQMAQQQMANRGANPSIQDDPATSRMVMETSTLSRSQLYSMATEFKNKLQAIRQAADDELAKLTPPKKTCPAVNTVDDEPACTCINELYRPYLAQRVAVEEKYNRQKTDLYNQYLPKVRAICTQIDGNIAKLQMGDAVKTKQLKDLLFSAQSQSFALASEFAETENDIRRTDADIYRDLANSNRNVYIINCVK